MRRLLVVGAAVFVVLAGAFATNAAAGGVDKYSFAGATTDGGSCGNDWANDVYTLDITVRKTGVGSYAVSTMYKNGSFTTIAGASPGACSTDDGVNHHGALLNGGIKGSFTGQIDQVLTGATYNPNGCAIASSCNSRTAALANLFPTGSRPVTSFNFEYNSSDKTLGYRHWQDKSDNQTGNDKFQGDIANS